jgi:ATP-dependent exoDNAse (exonuclease V) beta subunit
VSDVYERSKVILYNFFEESAPENFWQILVDANQNKLLDSKYAPLIHEVSNSVHLQRRQKIDFLVVKLKCFYVAITRAKHRLWIVDYSEKCKPIMVRNFQ